MSGDASLERLLERADLWRAGQTASGRSDVALPSGHPALDSLLPSGGWPAGTLVELIGAASFDPGDVANVGGGAPAGRDTAHPPRGVGAVTLLLPTMAALTARRRHVVLVDPPYVPYAPALAAAGVALPWLLVVHSGNEPGEPLARADALWASEQVLSCRGCGLALMWADGRLSITELRRLKLAAARGGGTGVVYRPAAALAEASAAELRLAYAPVPSATGDQRLALEIVKARGGIERRRCVVKLWPHDGATVSA